MKSVENSWSLFRLSDRKQFDSVSLATIDFFFRALPEKHRPDWLMWREGFAGWRPFSELPQILKHLQGEGKDSATPPPVPESVLKFADEVTGVRSDVKIETHDALPEDRGAHVDSADDVTESKVIEFQSPHSEPNPGPEPEAVEDDEPMAKTHSSVSVRAIEAATSSLRLKTTTGLLNQSSMPSGAKYQKPLQSAKEMNVLSSDNEATLSLMLESQAATEDRNNVRYQKRFKVRIYTPQGVVAVVTADCSTSGFRLKDPLPAGLPRFFHVELDLGPEGKIPLVCSEIREKDGRGSTRVRIQVNDHMNALKSALVRAA